MLSLAPPLDNLIHSPLHRSMYQMLRLGHEHVADFRRLRLAALHDAPSAFTTSLATEEGMAEAQQRDRIAGPSLSAVWGAFDASGTMVASTGVLHLLQDKVVHKASVYAVYVAPSARGRGLSRQLVEAAIAYARSQPQLHQLQLSVTGTNVQAHKLYCALGFVEYGREPRAILADGSYHDQILMTMDLRPAA